MDKKELEHYFSAAEPSVEQEMHMDAIRSAAMSFAQVIVDHAQSCADKTASIRKLRECVATACDAVMYRPNIKDPPVVEGLDIKIEQVAENISFIASYNDQQILEYPINKNDLIITGNNVRGLLFNFVDGVRRHLNDFEGKIIPDLESIWMCVARACEAVGVSYKRIP